MLGGGLCRAEGMEATRSAFVHGLWLPALIAAKVRRAGGVGVGVEWGSCGRRVAGKPARMPSLGREPALRPAAEASSVAPACLGRPRAGT